MAAENITDKIVEKVELAADVGIKVANVVGSAFEKTIADVDHSSGADEDTWLNYLLSFGIHIAMVVIVLLLKWQYGMYDEYETLTWEYNASLQIVTDIGIRRDHATGETSRMPFLSIERNGKTCWC